MQQFIRVNLKAFDSKVVEKAVREIVKTVVDSGAKIKGPVMLPNKIWKVAVRKSVYVDAKSKEHFALTTHSRLIEIFDYNQKTVESLYHLQMPAGVDIIIKVK